MRRVWAIAVCAAALTGPSSWAAAPEAPRLRERLPAGQTERPAPAIPKPPAADQAEGQDARGVLAAPDAIRLDGAVAIAPEAFEKIFSRFVRRGLTRADLVVLTREITDIYRAEGYFLSRAVIPPQTLSNGVLVVNIEEGRFVAVEFEGGGGEGLQDYFLHVLAEIPARRETLERAILTLGDLAGVTVLSSKTAPMPGTRGEYKLVLQLRRTGADGLLYVDNRGQGGGDALQLSAQAGFNDVGGVGNRVEVSVFTDPGNPARRQFGEISASAPLGLRGTIVSASLSASNSVEGRFGEGRYRSSGADVSVAIRHPVVRSRKQSLWVDLELAQSNSGAEIETLGLRRDELSIASLGAELDLRDEWGGRNRLRLAAAFGRDAFEAPDSFHPMARNDDGASFTKFTLLASRTQSIAADWSLFASVRGQYSADNLPEDEEISFGGARWGRAYDYGEIEGDTGAAGQVELRYTHTGFSMAESLQGYAFADAAAVWIRDGEGEPDTLASAGLGMRAAFAGGYRAGVEAALPLDRVPNGQGNRDPRLFATVSKEF
jgi:hemolysin activation/secretion protein